MRSLEVSRGLQGLLRSAGVSKGLLRSSRASKGLFAEVCSSLLRSAGV